MKEPPTPKDEKQRVATLHALGVLDTPPEERFDRVTRLAQHIFQVPIAVVSLVDVDRQWFKSHAGLDATETPREISFCGHAILDDGMLVVPDALLDQRFADNPLVTGDPSIRFYAGFPLEASNGHKLGTLCLIDRKPRELSASQRSMLRDLGEMVERELLTYQMATEDELTGLTNRRGFMNVANKAFSICQRLDRPALLLYFDLDGFKAINDQHGHAAGDRALQEVAEQLRQAFRESDVIARLGGDEFVVFLTGTAGGDEALARFRSRIDAHNAQRQGPYDLAYSVGVARLDRERHASIQDLLDEADGAMLATKTR